VLETTYHIDELRQAWAAAALRQDLADIATYQALLPAVMAGSMANAAALLEIINYLETQVRKDGRG